MRELVLKASPCTHISFLGVGGGRDRRQGTRYQQDLDGAGVDTLDPPTVCSGEDSSPRLGDLLMKEGSVGQLGRI